MRLSIQTTHLLRNILDSQEIEHSQDQIVENCTDLGRGPFAHLRVIFP